MQNEIRIARACAAAIESHARKNPEVEICGLLTGRDGLISQIIAARNAAPNPAVAYEVAPQELIPLLRGIRESGLELLGIYHSHPRSENFPSPKDIELAAYPDAAYVIFSPAVSPEQCLRAFSIRDAVVTELAIEVV